MVPHYAVLLLRWQLSLDELPVDGAHPAVQLVLCLLDVDLRDVGLCAQVGDGEEVSVCEQLFLEVLVATTSIMQYFVGLRHDVVIAFRQMSQHKLVLLLAVFLLNAVGQNTGLYIQLPLSAQCRYGIGIIYLVVPIIEG